jgi:SAM-dependent methyltransferase
MSNFREASDEQDRIASLLQLLPPGRRLLEIGARDGYITRLLAERYEKVVALDLEKPSIEAPRVHCVKGDVRALNWPADHFDVVLCSEVLEHIQPENLTQACRELARVAKGHVVIGVPFEQDLRVARTRCAQCGAINPPYGHVNRFDRMRLESLFASLRIVGVEHVASTREGTNAVSDLLMRAAGYPWGTYDQDESCISCGGKVGPPPGRSNVGKILTALAIRLDRTLARGRRPRPKWLHMVFAKGT